MDANEIESISEPRIQDYIKSKSRIVGESYIPTSKGKVYSVDELARKYGLSELITPYMTEHDVLQLFNQHLPFKVIISEAPFCYAVELNKDNFVHLLSSKDYLPKQYLSGVPINLPFNKFRLELDGVQYHNLYERQDIINRLGESWKLW